MGRAQLNSGTLRKLLASVRSIASTVVHRSKVEHDMDEELRSHIQHRADDLERGGLPRAEAERRAQIEFGAYERSKEEIRQTLGAQFFETLLQDLRFGLRVLRKSPGFTMVAVLTLALGIGANTALFSAVYSLMLRPLPYPDPGKLTFLWCQQPSRGIPELPPSIPDYLDWQNQLHSFDAIAGFWATEFAINYGTDSKRVLAVHGFADYFKVLETKPLLGRTFTAEDQQWGRHQVVVISEGLWKSMFGGAPDIIGRSITMDAEPYTVIGVMPGDFAALNPKVQMWVPASVPPNVQLHRVNRFMRVIGRIKAGVSEEQAAADLQTAMAALAATYDEDKGISTYLVPAQQQLTEQRTRSALLLLLGAVGLFLLIACTNIANLISVRSSGRQKEFAVRAVLGARQLRLARQLIVEHLVLAICGGIAGIALAYGGVEALRQVAVREIARAAIIRVDTVVLLFGFSLTLLTGVLFSVLPAVQAFRLPLHEGLKTSERNWAGNGGRRLRSTLVILETALSLALLICAGLLINSFYHLRNVNAGFSADRVLAAEVDLPGARYKEDQQRRQFVGELMARVSRLPGASAVGATETLPLHPGNQFWVGLERQGHPIGSWEKMPVVAFAHVTPGYFSTMKIPVLRGRLIDEQDKASFPPVAVISETLQRRFFDSTDPIGTQVRLRDDPAAPWLTVVGVVGDVSLGSLDRPKPPYLYVPFDQGINGVPGDMILVVRTERDPLSEATSLREQLHELDSSLALADLTTVSTVVDEALSQPRLTAVVMLLFAGAAALLAGIGIYSVLAYAVSQRTKEIGVRVALGARKQDVLLPVVGEGVRATLIGVGAGLALAVVGTRLLTGLLYGIRPFDAITYISAAALLLAIAALAAYMPARTAMRVDPMVALRYE